MNEEYEFKEFMIDIRRPLIYQLQTLAKEGWHSPFKPYENMNVIIMQRKVKKD